VNEELGCYAYFPEIWNFGDDASDGNGGGAVSDPGTIYIVNDYDEDVTLKTTLSSIVDDAICGHIIGEKIDIDAVDVFIRIKDALKAEIDKIDGYLPDKAD
tara:strand:- start:246 stop:548 length:303 start_codon:yes stop_codon:yes gene_type:complete